MKNLLVKANSPPPQVLLVLVVGCRLLDCVGWSCDARREGAEGGGGEETVFFHE